MRPAGKGTFGSVGAQDIQPSRSPGSAAPGEPRDKGKVL